MDQLHDLRREATMSYSNWIDFYNEKIWCDVITMDVGQVILVRSWLFDKDVTIHGRSNMCQFEHEGKKIKLLPLRPKAASLAPNKTKEVNLISAKDLIQELKNGAPIMILAAWEVVEKKDNTIPLKGTMVIKEFSEVFQKDLPNKLPPTRNIQHTINLVSGLSLPNLSHYRMNPTEHVKLKRQVLELARVSLRKAWAFVRSSHCWRQRKMDIGAYALIINKITIKYHFSSRD